MTTTLWAIYDHPTNYPEEDDKLADVKHALQLPPSWL
jgi:hypothetical protein